MQVIINPPHDDIRKYGTLAHVEQGERNRVLATMNSKGLRQYCDEIERIIERKKAGKA